MMALAIVGMLTKGFTPEEVVAALIVNPLFLNVPPLEVAARVSDVVNVLQLTHHASLLVNLLS